MSKGVNIERHGVCSLRNQTESGEPGEGNSFKPDHSLIGCLKLSPWLEKLCSARLFRPIPLHGLELLRGGVQGVAHESCTGICFVCGLESWRSSNRGAARVFFSLFGQRGSGRKNPFRLFVPQGHNADTGLPPHTLGTPRKALDRRVLRKREQDANDTIAQAAQSQIWPRRLKEQRVIGRYLT